MGIRSSSAVALGLLAGFFSRALGRGGGTAVTGLVAEKVSPGLLFDLIRQIPLGSVFVTGTNGKTTTTRMIAQILRRQGWEYLHNRSGSNLTRGLTTTLLENASLLGRLSVGSKTIGLFEVDEAVLPLVLQRAPARVIVLLNLFRDQLDRYGEVDSIAENWRRSLQEIADDTILVLNADDPLVANLGRDYRGKVVYFGLNDVRQGRPQLAHAADSKWCQRCGAEYTYAVSFFGHIGHYTCTQCGAKRPSPQIAAEDLVGHGFGGTRFRLVTPEDEAPVDLAMPGLYNVYNALAAAAAAYALGVPIINTIESLTASTAAFGRMERVEVEGRQVYLVLSKNPVGFNEVISALRADSRAKNLLFALNDRIADGRDISWIWDVDFELLTGGVRTLVTSGTRAADMALRLQYAGALPGNGQRGAYSAAESRDRGAVCSVAPAKSVDEGLTVEPDLGRAFDLAFAQVERGETLYILTTYTAMLEMRGVLVARGYLKQHWEEER